MANNIRRKDLFQRLGNIKREEEWLSACKKLGLRICPGSKHSSTVRSSDPKLLNDTGKASLIAVIPTELHKIMNQKIFKELLKFGVKEDDIWKALNLLK